MATALDFALHEDVDGVDPPIISIPESEANEEEYFIEEDEEGNWNPVNV